MSENEENNVENIKINFFKKVYYSIFKISKYDEMAKIGLKDAIKYIFKLTAIVTCILSLFLSFNMKKYVSKFADFLDENLPELYIENNVLNLADNEAVILDNKQVIENLNCIVIINCLLDENEAVTLYQDMIKENNCMILTEDEVVFVPKGYNIKDISGNTENIVDESNKEKIDEEKNTELEIQKYDELLSKYNIKIENKLTKSDLVNKIKSNPITYYFVQYFIIYFIVLLFTFFIEILLIAALVYIFTKALKIQLNSKKEIFILSIYEFTLPIILQLIYLVLGILFEFSINSSIIQTIMVLIAFAYAGVILYMKKKK